MRSAIVLDGNLKSALCAVRSLGARGIAVCCGAERETGMALHSRFTTQRFVYPSPYDDRVGFIQSVKNEALRLGDKPVIYAFSDATFLTLFAYRRELEEYTTLIFPDDKSIEIAFDKSATYSLARVSGVPTIPTYTPERHDEVIRLAEKLSYPIVVKSRRSVTWREGKGFFGTAGFVHTKDELIRRFQEIITQTNEAPIIQDLVYGDEYGVEMLAHKGKVFGVVSHHRIRSLSPTGGAAVLKEILNEGDLRSTLESYAKTLVHKLKWSGPIMVEFKVDSDSFTPYLMEINGRFWGSLPLSVASGVDVPYMYYEYSESKKIPLNAAIPREGTTTRHFLGDLFNLTRVFFSCNKMRPYLFETRRLALRNFFAVRGDVVSDVWSWDDYRPAIMEFVDVFEKYFRKRTRTNRSAPVW